MKGKYLILVSGCVLMILVIVSYTAMNRLDPVHTCAKCHEVAASHATWTSSAHAEVHCIQCHGTAMSNGLHSLKEKAGMITRHLSGGIHPEDVSLTEKQVLETAERCIVCHQSEHAGWLASGHAVNYREIFMDADHNAMEKPYWDCFRCHGMFFDGNINDLMHLDGKPSAWAFKDKKQELLPAIPCLACHQIHTENPVSKRYVSSTDSAAKNQARNPRTAFYVRSDKMHLRSDMLTPVAMKDGDRQVNRAIDPNTRLCQQCHAPDYIHRAGSQDDCTPTGIHEGVSCTACHKMHSGNTRESCACCHSEVSKNCKQDVRQMNTTYLSRNSPNDVHRLTCVSCHEEKNTVK